MQCLRDVVVGLPLSVAEYMIAVPGDELDPDDAFAAYNNLGIAYKNQGNLTKAIQSYEKAIELEPDDAVAYMNLGVAYHNSNFDKALIYYKKAARLGLKGIQDWLKENGYEW